jgi:lipoprotein-releasing system ATP-binding protein
LDTSNARALHDLFFKLRDTYHLSFVLVTHNEELAGMADRKVMMKDGRIEGA